MRPIAMRVVRNFVTEEYVRLCSEAAHGLWVQPSLGGFWLFVQVQVVVRVLVFLLELV